LPGLSFLLTGLVALDRRPGNRIGRRAVDRLIRVIHQVIVIPGPPGCLPGRRFPRSRSDRSLSFFLYGLSEEGGRDDVEESLRACRSSSSTRAESRPICAVSRPACAVSSAISRYASASRTASSAAGTAESSSAEGTPGTPVTPGNDHHSGQLINNPPRRVVSYCLSADI